MSERTINWVAFSKRRYQEWNEDGSSVFNAFIAYCDAQEVGYVYCIGGDVEHAYGQVFGHRVGSCENIDAAKKAVEIHFNRMMSGKPSDLWHM